VTLDQSDLKAVTTAATSTDFTQHRLWLNGVEEDVSSSKRFLACVNGVAKLASDKICPKTGAVLIRKEDWARLKIHISSYNTFPTAAGLASSAAGYAALVHSLATLMNAKETYPGELSTVARQGSGSACRSLYGGFVAWRMGSHSPTAADSLAEQVADEKHWPSLRALILVVSDLKKDTSSTEGMSTSVATSKLLNYRSSSGLVDERMKAIEAAYKNRDFEAFGKITMQDSNQFHATCLDTYPPIFYMNDVSKSVIKIVHAYNEFKGAVKVAYTFDAGPNAVLYMEDESMTEVLALMLHYFPGNAGGIFGSVDSDYVSNSGAWAAARGYRLDRALISACDSKGRVGGIQGDVKMMYVTRAGPGPIVMSEEESLIDLNTGLNRYVKESKVMKKGNTWKAVVAAAVVLGAVGVAFRQRK
jgi:diphosphomevalonate decarboxylase